MSISKKILSAFFCVILLTIISICVVIGLQMHKTSVEAFYSSSAKELTQISRAVDIFMDSALKMTRLAAEIPLVRSADESVYSYVDETAALSPDSASQSVLGQRMMNYFRLMEKSHPEYAEVFLGTKWGGYATSRTGTIPAGYDPRRRAWYTQGMSRPGEVSISPAYMSTTGEAVVSTLLPVRAENNELLGCLGIDVGLAMLTELVEKSPVGETGYVILVQDDGTILANPRHKEFNLKKLTETGVAALAALNSISEGGMEVDMDDTRWFAQVKTIEGLNWKLVGFIEKDEVLQNFHAMLVKMAVMGTVLAAVFLGMGGLFARTIARPVRRATDMLRDVAEGEGDLTRKLEVNTSDEIGEMAGWFNTFLNKLRVIIHEMVQDGGVLSSASERLYSVSGDLSRGVDSAAEQVRNLTQAARNLNDNFTTVAAAMEQTTQNTNMVATATEEMAVTIREISTSTERARAITGQAMHEADTANKAVESLGEAARDIDKVTALITEISAQTNLLALNATIEAARAGEAGRGFAVVANEIKELAGQTASATEEIKQRIAGIQQTSHLTGEKIQSIYNVIENVNEIISGVATAIEEQSVATTDIADNVSQASQGLQEVNVNVARSSTVIAEISAEIENSNAATERTRVSTAEVARNAEELQKLASHLFTLLGRFRTEA